MTPEERAAQLARKISHVLNRDEAPLFGEIPLLIANEIRAAEAEAVARERKMCLTDAAEFAARYPEDIFPPIKSYGECFSDLSDDRKAAHCMRMAARQIAQNIEIRARAPEVPHA